MVSISANRVTVMAACVAWFFIVQPNTGSHVGRTTFSLEKDTSVLPVRNMLFVLILVLGIGENLSASGNMISVRQTSLYWTSTSCLFYVAQYHFICLHIRTLTRKYNH